MDIAYKKATKTHKMKFELKELTLDLQQEFYDIFDGAFGHWDTGPVDLQHNTNKKYYIDRSYTMPKNIKENF